MQLLLQINADGADNLVCRTQSESALHSSYHKMKKLISIYLFIFITRSLETSSHDCFLTKNNNEQPKILSFQVSSTKTAILATLVHEMEDRSLWVTSPEQASGRGRVIMKRAVKGAVGDVEEGVHRPQPCPAKAWRQSFLGCQMEEALEWPADGKEKWGSSVIVGPNWELELPQTSERRLF